MENYVTQETVHDQRGLGDGTKRRVCKAYRVVMVWLGRVDGS